jgi:hypothetical protein
LAKPSQVTYLLQFCFTPMHLHRRTIALFVH